MLRLVVFANAMVLGFALMGLEMLGSRYLNPYFGGGTETWAALISTVLAAVMLGYFCGGEFADRWPRVEFLGVLILASAALLALVPLMASSLIEGIMSAAGDGPGAVLLSAAVLLLLPLALMSTFSPFGVRLTIQSSAESGRASGWIYGISTVGNILGTLATTFVLIPNVGTRTATWILAATSACCGLSLLGAKYLSSTKRDV